ncbi:hypothetical protein [Granulicella rosea]|uniref:hypothetical protein n=1 Tax=Granulicella rosea TaxID=474952 RepID=UPI001596163D|nr:hypothetical protein [Granulicella rosea]
MGHALAHHTQLPVQTIAILALSIAVAFLTARYLDAPIDRFRQMRLQRRRSRAVASV